MWTWGLEFLAINTQARHHFQEGSWIMWSMSGIFKKISFIEIKQLQSNHFPLMYLFWRIVANIWWQKMWQCPSLSKRKSGTMLSKTFYQHVNTFSWRAIMSNHERKLIYLISLYHLIQGKKIWHWGMIWNEFIIFLMYWSVYKSL